ncbi:tetratricopeptide repeat protein [Micromonospora sp. WMMD1102]|uniref:ATP-binding protein n=1 Tax=Micromonospora sp. WMMD1102 TaxID=3016105 RepID=UPI002414F22E|nr:tetratricopeptide repeat protein [Micromonospora sp. WMMD1102]MDG4786497.1 tetratricopeptide repeat protein [Micromonospora sp. WMMD1102]
MTDWSGERSPGLSHREMARVQTVAELAALLRHLRRREARLEGASPLTYRELAAKTGWSRGILGEYFAGRVLPPTDRFDILIRLLGATPGEQGALATARDRVEERRRPAGPAEPVTPAPASPRQLPPTVPGFTGRASQLAELDRLLEADPAAPVALITAVSGTAGVGKTALALHWAHRVADRFSDGQLYLNLRGFDPTGSPVAPAEAIRALLDALGVPPQRIPATLDGQAALYRGLLAARHTLVVLDNARDADQVRPLLPGGPACRVLVTSRNQLAGLVSTGGARPIVLDLLNWAEARQLLAARIGAERVAAEPRAVDDIVNACSRLPLGLAIVAARAALNPGFALGALAAELGEARGGLAAFTGSDPASDVRAVFSWSYRALGPETARLFRLLALHPGPSVGTPAVASLAGLPPGEVRPLLAELTDANLVAEHGPGRYACHDLLVAYAAELTVAVDPEAERRAASRRVLDHYLHTAHAADRRLDPHRDPIPLLAASPGVTPGRIADHGAALAWFDLELPALLATAEEAATARLDRQLCRLTRTMAHVLERRGHWHRWAAVQELAVAAAQRLADPAEEAHARRSLGRALVHLGRVEPAVDQLDIAGEFYRVAADRLGQGRIQFDRCWIAVRQNRYPDALRHSRAALDLFTAAGSRSGQGRALNNIGWCLSWLGHHEEGVEYCRQALDVLLELDDRFGAADAWDSLGHAQHELGRYREAAESYQHSYALWRELGHRYQEADLLARLGDTQSAIGDLDAASDTWHRALDILDDLDHPDAEQVKARLDRVGRAPGR